MQRVAAAAIFAAVSGTSVLKPEGFDELLAALVRRGYTLVGPTVRQRAVVLDEISGAADLPAGVTDVQDGGSYRISHGSSAALFSHNAGPNSWKGQLFPPRLALWRASRDAGGGLDVERQAPDDRPRAFIGVRSCDLHAVAIQDRVFMGDRYVDADYASRRRDAFFVAVNCGRAGGTCFCSSMDTGPRVEGGYDLALTELLDDDGHRFVVEVGSEHGADVLREIATRPASDGDIAGADAVVRRAADQQVRQLDTTDIRDLLLGNLEHPRWDDVAARCLTCANCTLVCPTCFCSTVEDVTDLSGEHAERCLSCGNCTQVCPTCFCSTVEDVTDLAGEQAEHARVWDSCFSLEHSHVHDASVRSTTRSRYRQWMTHKLATWIDQFGTSGCVGCGRCIAWCPVAIDITEEVAAIRATDGRADGSDAHD
jgi:ferredoxin